MITQESICETIEDIKNQPMTPERIHVLADLIYIKRHMAHSDEGHPMNKEQGEELHLSKEQALAWVDDMKNADGTDGPRWTMEKTEEVRKHRDIQCDPLEFYVAVNMMYSDYSKAAEKIGCSNMDFYAYMAQAFLDDKDAQKNKLAKYYEYVVEH